jgi:hypothetical protein
VNTSFPNAALVRRDSLRGRLFACLAESPLPVSTVGLYLICAAGLPNGRVRVWQELTDQERRGRVLRLPPLPHDGRDRDPPRRGRAPGQGAVRWAITPAGLALVLAAHRRRRGRREGGGA